MNVRDINQLLLQGVFDREDMWPRLVEYENKMNPFFFEFGIRELPLEPGILSIRGPRQYGKSTWLDLMIRDTVKSFGKGSALYLNGDELLTEESLFTALCEKVKKISFILIRGIRTPRHLASQGNEHSRILECVFLE